jgi:hypothetical protein
MIGRAWLPNISGYWFKWTQQNMDVPRLEWKSFLIADSGLAHVGAAL